MALDDSSTHLAKALSHPRRVQILTLMNTPTRRLSPAQFCREKGGVVTNVGYHFRQLAKMGFIELVDEVPVRGSLEHVYFPLKKALAWSKEWNELPDSVKDRLAASALRNFVEGAGEAIDEGTFHAREDSHLSWDTMRVDDPGWGEVTELMNETLKKLLAIQSRIEKRMGKDEEGFLISYGMTAFEAPPPDPDPS